MQITNFYDFIELNYILICSVAGWAIAQLLKTIIHLILAKKFVAERLFGSGGMPSSHSATVCALATSTLFIYGYQSFEFAIATIFSLVVMYDAIGVRQETGKQSKILNEMMRVFQDMGDKWKSPEERLKEFIGHTPLQVLMGAILGIFIAIILRP